MYKVVGDSSSAPDVLLQANVSSGVAFIPSAGYACSVRVSINSTKRLALTPFSATDEKIG